MRRRVFRWVPAGLRRPRAQRPTPVKRSIPNPLKAPRQRRQPDLRAGRKNSLFTIKETRLAVPLIWKAHAGFHFPACQETMRPAGSLPRSGFARMNFGVGLQRRCWTRRSFEPILNLRVPESDGPCAWPAVDFGSLRESLKAGAGRPLFTGGSGSSSTRRSGPLHFFMEPQVPR